MYSTLNEPIVPYDCDQKGELNGQKEKTLPMRKLKRSGTLLGGGRRSTFYSTVPKHLRGESVHLQWRGDLFSCPALIECYRGEVE